MATTTVNVTLGALIFSGWFRGIPLPGTPGGPKRQLTIVHSGILNENTKVTVRLARHGSYAVSAPASLLEAWSLIEPKPNLPLPLPRDADRLFVCSILDDGCNRGVVEKILRLDQAERIAFAESARHESGRDPEDQAGLERVVHHCISTAYAYEAVEKARRSSMSRPGRGKGLRHG